ncbi:ATP-binding protein, partial [Chloroflexota bacterium]
MWQVIGQTRAVTFLQRSLETDSLAHAYLFIGPAHVGKMTLALNLAQALNCEATEPPCGECASCEKVVSGKHADVQIIDLGSNQDSAEAENRTRISVGQIEQLQHSASLPPFEGKCKVFIIDKAELLSGGAANRFLKTLEEPEDKIVFILLTINERLLPATVVSRCQRVELLPMSIAEVEAALTGRWSIEPQKAKLLARLSHGCLGWAVSAALDDVLLKQRTECLDELLDVTNAGCEERFAYVTQLATQFSQNRGLVQEKLDLWLNWWRDLLLVKVGLSNTVTNIDRLSALNDVGRKYSLAQIKDFIDSIRAAGTQLRQNANPRLVLEVLMLGIPEAEKHSLGSK